MYTCGVSDNSLDLVPRESPNPALVCSWRVNSKAKHWLEGEGSPSFEWIIWLYRAYVLLQDHSAELSHAKAQLPSCDTSRHGKRLTQESSRRDSAHNWLAFSFKHHLHTHILNIHTISQETYHVGCGMQFWWCFLPLSSESWVSITYSKTE